MIRIVLGIGALLAVIGCGSASSDGPAAEPVRPADPEVAGEAEGEGAAESETAAAPPPEGPVRVHYDLGSWLPRAEVRQGTTLVVDFGAPGGAKYTLGGWTSGT